MFFLKFCLAEGRLEVFQGERLLSSIPMWTTFGELAILYNCTRTASVKGNGMKGSIFELLHNAYGNLSHYYCLLSISVSHWAPCALVNGNAMLTKEFILKHLSK